MTEDLLKTIYEAIKDQPLAPCPYNTNILCDNPPRLKGVENCVWLDDCLKEWLDRRRDGKTDQ